MIPLRIRFFQYLLCHLSCYKKVLRLIPLIIIKMATTVPSITWKHNIQRNIPWPSLVSQTNKNKTSKVSQHFPQSYILACHSEDFLSPFVEKIMQQFHVQRKWYHHYGFSPVKNHLLGLMPKTHGPVEESRYSNKIEKVREWEQWEGTN